MQKVRDPSFDAFRGLAIIAVVAIHATGLTALSWKNSEINGWNLIFLVANRQLFLFAVPVFLFISGYWSPQKRLDSLRDYGTFLIKKLLRILAPYFFWSLLLLGYEAFKTHDVNMHKIAFNLMAGRASMPYYFIVVIAQFYVLAPLFQYLNRKIYGLTSVLVFNIITLSVLYLTRLCDTVVHLPVMTLFYSWTIFYQAGLFIRNCDSKAFVLSQKMRRIIPVAVLFFVLLSVIESMILLIKYDNLLFAGSSVKYSSFLYSACIILGFLCLREQVKNWPKLLTTIGNLSFGIFFIHLPVLKIVAGVIQKISVVYTFQPLYQFIIVSLTISICCLLISVTRKLLPKAFCSRVLGF